MHILDMYDDPSASVLRGHLGRTSGRLTEKLAAFQPNADGLLDLPDRLFALVGTQAGEKIRKYAMHDPEHLATSILYFLECGGQLSEDVRTKVAMNLITGCGWYQTPPPEALTKVAFLGSALATGLTAASVPGTVRKSRETNVLNQNSLRAAQMSGIKEASRARHVTVTNEEEAHRTLERFIRGEEDTADTYAAFGDGYPNPFDDPEGLAKSADLAGTEAASFGALSNDPRPKTPQRRFASGKVANVGEVVLKTAQIQQAAPATYYALPARFLYPIDTVEQVKRASVYFDQHHQAFEMDDRRIFAQSVATRAAELGVPIHSYTLEKLAGDEYGPHIRTELQGRISALEGTDKEAAYEVLLENLDDIPPIVMYDMLKLADRKAGLDEGYGRPVTGMRDPLSAVFGAPERPIYSWADKGHYVNEEILRSYAKLVPQVDKLMGEGWSERFCKDPIKAFEQLSDDQKIIVARIANREAFRTI